METERKKYWKGIRLSSTEVFLVLLALKNLKHTQLQNEINALIKRFEALDERYGNKKEEET